MEKRRFFLLVVVVMMSIVCHSQTYKFFETKNYHNQLRLNTQTGELYQMQDDGQTFLVHEASTPESDIVYRYWLYPTQNMWTFILLDTFCGKLWQCQFSVEGSKYIFSIPINNEYLSYTNKSKFSVSPMTSMYQFYLNNEETGEQYQFQWTTKSDDGYRWIKKIH